MSDVIKRLRQLNESDEYPLHMPGHKRNYDAGLLADAYGIDITEIIGYDNLYEAEGMLKNAMERAAGVYGAEETFFLVNGSTVGILSAITGVTKRGDRILVARNCHKAVFHAIELRELQAIYLHPEYLPEWEMAGGIRIEEVSDILEQYPDIKAVVITSPTYEGIVSDIEEIAGLVHAKNIPLIVDEAHGAHFPFDERFPKSAIQCGADVIIQSMHKTLPSFTQTALLHMKKGYVDTARIREYIGYYQTSSPSYLFMAGMDYCIGEIEEKGSHLWDSFFEMRGNFLKKMDKLSHIRIFQENDPCKLVISVKGTKLSGKDLQNILLEKYHIQPEMAAESYVLGIITMCDTKEGFDRLGNALSEIDNELSGADSRQNISENRNITNLSETQKAAEDYSLTGMSHEEIVYSLAQVRERDTEKVLLEDAEGKVCASYVNLYPPGIPLILPGERIAKEHIDLIKRYLNKKMHVQGVENSKLRVCR